MAVLLDYLFEFYVGGRTQADLEANPIAPIERLNTTVESFPAQWTEYGFHYDENYGRYLPVKTGGTMSPAWVTGDASPDIYDDWGNGPIWVPGEVSVRHFFNLDIYADVNERSFAPGLKLSVGAQWPDGAPFADLSDLPEGMAEDGLVGPRCEYGGDGYWRISLFFYGLRVTQAQAASAKFYVFVSGDFADPLPGFWTNFRKCKEIGA